MWLPETKYSTESDCKARGFCFQRTINTVGNPSGWCTCSVASEIQVSFFVILMASAAPGIMSSHDSIQSRRVGIYLCTSLIREVSPRRPSNNPSDPIILHGITDHIWATNKAGKVGSIQHLHSLCKEGSAARGKTGKDVAVG